MSAYSLRIDAPAQLTRKWLSTPATGGLPATRLLVADARQHALSMWRERALERGEAAPTDLSGSCKFVSIFVKLIFGGSIEGNASHQFNRLCNGEILDLNRDAADVALLDRPYFHDTTFFGNPEHIESLGSCVPRSQRWAELFLASL